jgi:hypothetical protein
LSERELQFFLRLAKGETFSHAAEKVKLGSNSDATYYAMKNGLIHSAFALAESGDMTEFQTAVPITKNDSSLRHALTICSCRCVPTSVVEICRQTQRLPGSTLVVCPVLEARASKTNETSP